jgi:hypothetical protein
VRVSDETPLVIVPLRNAGGAVDASLSSLQRCLPAGSEVWLLGDDGLDPHIEALVRNWLATTRLAARLRREDGAPGPLRSCHAALNDAARDTVLMQPGACATPGALAWLGATLVTDAQAATLSPWSNDAELLSYPRFGEPNPMPTDADELAEAASGLPASADMVLPAAVGGAVAFRASAWRQLGGFDIESYTTLAAAIGDYSRRAAAMGWRNAFCPRVFVPYDATEPLSATGEDLQRLLARWPDHYERTARFLLQDPMREWRERLARRQAEIARRGPQRDLFGTLLP